MAKGDKDRPAQGYRQIGLTLEDAIRTGRYPPGSPFPSETELMADFNVSRLTIRRALEGLVDQRMIERHRGRGSFVSSRRFQPPVKSALGQATRQHIDMARTIDIHFLSRSLVTPTPAIRKLFGLKPSEAVEQIAVVRATAEEAIAFVIKDVPRWASELVPHDESGGFVTIDEVLKSHGIVTHRLRQTIGAENADPTIASRLGIQAGSPLLRFTRISYDQNERPFIHARALFRADRFEYDMEFVDDGLTG